MRPRTGIAAVVVVAALLASLGWGKAEARNQPPIADGKPSEAKPATPAPAGRSGEAPVTFEFLGLSADKEYVRYRIRVNTDKLLEQVDVRLSYTGADKKRQTETLIWQNIVKSRQQPIEKGKAYEAEGYLGPGATAVDCRLARVVYKDMTTWTPAN